MNSTTLPPSSKPVAAISRWESVKVPARGSCLAGMVILIGLVLWSYLPTLERIAVRWQDDPRYSHGYFVPLFAAVLLWTRRSRWSAPRPSAWGLVLLASASLLRLTAALVYFDWLDAVSLLPCLAGLAVLLGGRALWNWAWPAILFLSFMLPLPHQLEVGLAGPLQRLATLISVYALQTLGFPALAQGNIILIEELRIGVLEACSGLGMLVTFFALSTAFAIVVDRPLLDRIVLFLSAAPIGVLANVLRITVTVVLHRTAGSEVANAVFHDLAGWFMMPLAVALLWFELRLLDRLFIPTETRLAGLYLARATDRD